MAQAGTVLGGRYVLDDQIGYGGYGEVWRATDTVLTRPVAVKLLHPRYTQRSEALARFRAEARHAGGVSHENIAQVFDYGEPADGQPPYLVMELVDGPSLETVLTGGPLDDRRTMDIVAQAAAGLQAAHAAGTAGWAGLLRDGVGVSALQMWPEQPPVAGLFQRRTILAYACVAVTAVVVIVLASVIGFASTPGPVAVPAPLSSSHGSSGGGDASAPSARSSATAPPARGPAASPGQAPAARSVA